MMRNQLDVDEPNLGRRKKVPKRLDEGSAQAEFAASPKDEYRRIYFEALDQASVADSIRRVLKHSQMWNNSFSRHVLGNPMKRS